MSKFKSVFNDTWLAPKVNPEFAPWLRAVPTNRNQARCTLCSKTFELSNMGRQAILSHQRSVSHVRSSGAEQRCHDIGSFLHQPVASLSKVTIAQAQVNSTSELGHINLPSAPASAAVLEASEDISLATTKSDASGSVSSISIGRQGKMTNFTTTQSVTDSEIIWSLKVVMSHLSFRSCKDLSETFRLMFPDSTIAHKFTLSAAKVAYTIVHGLAPHFAEDLVKGIQESTYFVACFDEALNKIAQKGQMDIVIRYWDTANNQVSSRYLTSVFLGHATAKDLEIKFREGLSSLSLVKLIQISMDGPSVNWKFLESFAESTRPNATDPKLFDLGSCGLHVVHGAFQTGHKAAGWSVNELLHSMYGLFKDSPARRADYTAATGSTCFPKKFCQVRWLANSDAANRAIEIFPHVQKYLEMTKKLPNNVTCNYITASCADPLAVAKLAFFASVASIFEPFLRKYQTVDPMMPFLHDDLWDMLLCLLKRFVKPAILKCADTSYKLMKIDLQSSGSVVNYKEVDIGVAAVKSLQTSKVSDRVKMEFRIECMNFMKAAALKLVERSPLKYGMVRSLTCLSPRNISRSRVISEKRMGDLLQKLFESNQISSVTADRAKVQFSNLCSHAETDLKEVFDGYTASKDRLDAFYAKILCEEAKFVELWGVVKFVMILSHGNASVESGFSVNGDMLVENMHEESLIAQRQVYDAVKSIGGILNVKIDKRMQQAARGAYSRYQHAVKMKKMASKEEEIRLAARKRAVENIKLLEAKKMKLQMEAAEETRVLEMEIAQLKGATL